MKPEELDTKEVKTWCPGCPNMGILMAVKQAITNLVNNKEIKVKDVVGITGIGCHAKMYDYLNVNGFYSLHGRVLPPVLGIKIANPELTVIGFGGDGDTYAEGMGHFVHSCHYNADTTMLVHNNQVFALTTGQATPVSEKGFKGKSTPLGVREKPVNPIALALVSGATFVARGYALNVKHLTKLIEEAIKHKGFSIIDILQPCIAFHDTTAYFKKHVYKLEDDGHNSGDYEGALKRAREWDYCFEDGTNIPIGIFYKVKRDNYEAQWPQLKKPWYTVERKPDWKKALDKFK